MIKSSEIESHKIYIPNVDELRDFLNIRKMIKKIFLI